jgi:hypothetical protein
LIYQWRKNGKNLPDGGNVSGATTANLTIRPFSAEDAGIYNVAVFNPAGSALSRNASVRLSQFDIQEGLAGYWKFDEASGVTAANSAPGGSPGDVRGGGAAWSSGQIGNALSFNGFTTYVFVENYPKAQRELSVSAWVRLDPNIPEPPVLIRNAEGALGIANPAEQFDFRLVRDADGSLRLSAAIAVGPNIARVTDSTAFTLGTWQHVAFSADGAQLRLYRNGSQVGSTDYTQGINQPDIPWLSIGARLTVDEVIGLEPNFAEPNFIEGQLDDLAIWTRGLTAEEVTKVFAAGQQGQPLTSVQLEAGPIDAQPPVLEVSMSGNNITVSWSNGKLQSASSVTGPWEDVTAESPLTQAAADEARFYRAVAD